MFCKSCGTQMKEDAKFCPSCGATNDAVNQEAGASAAPVQQPVAPAPAAPAAPSPFAIDLKKAITLTFSKDPVDGVMAAAESKAPIWAVLGGAYALITGLALWVFMGNVVSNLLGGMGAMFMGPIVDEIRGWMFTYGLISSISTLVVTTALVMGLYAILKINMPFVKVANLVTGSTMIYTAILVLSTIISFIDTWASIMVTGAGGVFFTVMLVVSMKRVTTEKVSGFWAVGTILIASAIAFALTSLLTPSMGVGDFGMFDMLDMFF